MDVLRPSLLPGLMHSLRHNITRKNYDVALFEIGRVFNNNNGATKEERRVAIALTGSRNPIFWSGEEREAKFDVSDLKGFAEELLEQFGVRGVAFTRRAESTALFIESATIALGGKLPLGEIGLVSHVLAKKYDLLIAEVVAAYADDALFANGAWTFGGPETRTLHHLARGTFFRTGERIDAVELVKK